MPAAQCIAGIVVIYSKPRWRPHLNSWVDSTKRGKHPYFRCTNITLHSWFLKLQRNSNSHLPFGFFFYLFSLWNHLLELSKHFNSSTVLLWQTLCRSLAISEIGGSAVYDVAHSAMHGGCTYANGCAECVLNDWCHETLILFIMKFRNNSTVVGKNQWWYRHEEEIQCRCICHSTTTQLAINRQTTWTNLYKLDHEQYIYM